MSIYSRETIENCINQLVDKYRIKQDDKFIFEKDNALYFCKMLSNKSKINATSENLTDSDAIEVLNVSDTNITKFKTMFDKVAKQNQARLNDSTTLLRSLEIKAEEDIVVYAINDSQYDVANEAIRELSQKQENKQKITINLKNIKK